MAGDGQTLFLSATAHNFRRVGETEVAILETKLK